MNNHVIIVQKEIYEYPHEGSFRPDKKYPEYPFREISDKKNSVYTMVREAFHLAGYDIENYETNRWNPLGKFIKPGDTVLLKPNLVMDNNLSGDDVECLYTQPAVVAAVLDYVWIAIKSNRDKGKVIIGDAPVQECDFERLSAQSGYDRLIEWYRNKGCNVIYEDFRELKSIDKGGFYQSSIGETKGVVVDITSDSEFSEDSQEQLNRLRITNYDPNLMKKHHNAIKHEYYISKQIISADVIINMPKPKTHRKAGITISLKNLVGISARKEYLPHHTIGSIKENGDEYLAPSFLKYWKGKILDKRNFYMQTAKKYSMAKILSLVICIFNLIIRFTGGDTYSEGNWYGNDTISRTIIDLNKIILYADKEGKLQSDLQRKYLIVADMIQSGEGEGEGPIMPSAKKLGVIAVGDNSVCFDEVIATLMGAKLSSVPTLYRARHPRGRYKLVAEDCRPEIISNQICLNKKLIEELGSNDKWNFLPAKGWEKVFDRI